MNKDVLMIKKKDALFLGTRLLDTYKNQKGDVVTVSLEGIKMHILKEKEI